MHRRYACAAECSFKHNCLINGGIIELCFCFVRVMRNVETFAHVLHIPWIEQLLSRRRSADEHILRGIWPSHCIRSLAAFTVLQITCEVEYSVSTVRSLKIFNIWVWSSLKFLRNKTSHWCVLFKGVFSAMENDRELWAVASPAAVTLADANALTWWINDVKAGHTYRFALNTKILEYMTHFIIYIYNSLLWRKRYGKDLFFCISEAWMAFHYKCWGAIFGAQNWPKTGVIFGFHNFLLVRLFFFIAAGQHCSRVHRNLWDAC